MANELIPITNPDPRALFVPGGLDHILKQIDHEARSLVPDISTREGREAIASTAAKVARAKTYLDGLGKDYVAELKALPKKIDAVRKDMRDRLDALKDDVRRPLTDWEAAREEEARQQNETITWIGLQLHGTAEAHIEDLEIRLATIESAVFDPSFGERWEEAKELQRSTIATLHAIIEGKKAMERNALLVAEVARKLAEEERQAREAQIAAEAAQKATEEAEARNAATLRAALDHAAKLEAEQRAIEAQRLTAEQEEAARVRNAEHRARIHREIIADLCMIGFSEDSAKALITAIARGRVGHLRIEY